MSKGKERERKREGKGREGRLSGERCEWGSVMTSAKCWPGFTGEGGGRERRMVGTRGKKKRKKEGNLNTKYVIDSECMKNI